MACLSSARAEGEPQPIPELTARVTDQAGVLSAQQESELESVLAAFEARKGVHRNGDGALSRDDRGRGGKHDGGHHRWKDGGGDGEGMGQGMGQGMGGGNAPGAEPPAPANP